MAIVEPHLIGGECSFYACMPSKALLRLWRAPGRSAANPGCQRGRDGASLDVAAVLERRDEIIHGLDDSTRSPWLESRNGTIFRGAGRWRASAACGWATTLLTARKAVVVATGSAPLLPPIEGLREAEPWTNREATPRPRSRRSGWPSWAAAWWAWSWPRPGAPWARR